MNILRQEHHVEAFRVLLQNLQGILSVERTSDRLSNLAGAALDLALETVWKQVATHRREIPRSAVVACGRLDDKELGYVPDPDITFLYDSDDERALNVYASFTHKLITWLASHTAAGILFDVDTRLCLNDVAGLMVTHFEPFHRYQMREGDNAAWMWEHQVPTRARLRAGDAGVGEHFGAPHTAMSRQAREPGSLHDEVVAIRERVAEGHTNPMGLLDLEHNRGGMVDIEFTVQFLMLLHNTAHAELTRNKGNTALLYIASGLELINATVAARVTDAYRNFRARQHRLRLDGQSVARVPVGTYTHETVRVYALWTEMFGPAQ